MKSKSGGRKKPLVKVPPKIRQALETAQEALEAVQFSNHEGFCMYCGMGTKCSSFCPIPGAMEAVTGVLKELETKGEITR